MENLLILYITCFIVFYFSGRAVFLVVEKATKKKTDYLFNLKKENFYILLGIICTTEFLFVSNFFFSLNKINLGLFFAIMFLVNLSKFSKITEFKYLFLNFLIIFILFISFYDINLSKDSYLYHLSTQNWLYTEKIVFGISNLNPYLGYVSINEYLTTLLNTFNTKGAHIFNLVFLYIFFSFLISFIYSKNKFYKNISLLISFFGILDNFGNDGGRNGFIALQEINKFDYTVSILCIIFIIFFLHINFSKKSITNFESVFLLLIIIFSTQLRFFTLLLTLLLIYQNIKYKKIILSQAYPLILLVLWFIKNFINTSCFIYPVYLTCFETVWTFENQAKYITNSVLDSYRDPSTAGINSIENFNWISEIFIPNNLNTILNFIFTLIVFYLFKKFSLNNVQIEEFKNKIITSLFFSLLLFIFWLFYLPQYRFASFFFITIFIILNLDYLFNAKPINSKLTTIFVFLALGLVINLNDYKYFVQDPITAVVSNQNYPSTEYEKRQEYGVRPVGVESKGVYCFAQKDCYTDDYDVRLKIFKYNYKAIIPIQTRFYTDLLE